MSFSTNDDIREFSTFDDTDLVKEITLSQARTKAERLILKYMKSGYLAKHNSGLLTADELFDLKVGEVQIATSILCKNYALRYTMYKFNRSISTGSIGGESDRDSQKNLDFLKMAPIFWEEGWGAISEYIDNVPLAAGMHLDPNTFFNFSVNKNSNLDALSEENLDIQWG
jgi:hypothetical protein